MCVLVSYCSSYICARRSNIYIRLSVTYRTNCIVARCPDKHCLSRGVYLYQKIMTLHVLNDVVNDVESTPKSILINRIHVPGLPIQQAFSKPCLIKSHSPCILYLAAIAALHLLSTTNHEVSSTESPPRMHRSHSHQGI